MPGDHESLALKADLVTEPLSGVPDHGGAPGHRVPGHQGRGGRRHRRGHGARPPVGGGAHDGL